MGNRILLTWNYDPNMTCDYVIKWCNSSQSGPCLMDWKKIPSNSTETVIESGRCLSEFFKDIPIDSTKTLENKKNSANKLYSGLPLPVVEG